MRVVFMGTPEFAVPSLKALLTAHEVVAVYTRPDAASGRGSALRASAVKQAALAAGIEVRQPTTLRDEAELSQLADTDADLIVVAAYGLILPAQALSAARLGALNVHASLLPRWRGAAPIQRAILAGDARTGVSIMQMEEGLDTGPFCIARDTDVDDKSAVELTEELAQMGAEALIVAISKIESGTCAWAPQDEAQVTYAEKIGKADVALSPDLTSLEALRRIRASSRQAPARAHIDTRGVTVAEASMGHDVDMKPGEIRLNTGGIAMGFSDGSILVTRIKPDSKSEMLAADWARGAQLSAASVWSSAL